MMLETRRRRIAGVGALILAALLALSMLAAGAAAQPQAPEEDPDDAPEARIDQSDPRTRDGCSVFQVMADDLPKDNGDFAVYRDAPGPDDPVYVEREFWTADAEEPDGDFQMGSRIIQTSDPGPFYGKVFWWEDGEERVLVTETERIECEGQQEPGELPECPDALTATALPNGDVHLDWLPANNSDTFEVLRAHPEEKREETLATLDAGTTEFVDETTVPGETYVYTVMAHNDFGSDTCGHAEVTAIPFFGAPLLGALALVGGVVAYARLRR